MNKYATVALICLSILVVSCKNLEEAGKVLVAGINPTSPTEARPRDAEQIKKSVVKITSQHPKEGRQQGTGFVVGVIGDKVYILTARHVVEGDSAPSVEFFGKVEKFDAIIVTNDRNVDISLLTVTGSIPTEAVPLYVVKNFEPQIKDSVFTFGFPVDVGKLSHERLSYSSTSGSDVLFSGNIAKGHSGGPVIKGDEVIGMVTDVDRHVHVLPAEIIRASLRGLNELVLNDMEKWQGAKPTELTAQKQSEDGTPPLIDGIETEEGDYDAGVEAYSRGDYTIAMQHLKPLAKQGNVEAQSYVGNMYQLGNMYQYGKGVEKNDEESIKWLRLSAEGGSLIGTYSLGFAYESGMGVKKDYQEAYVWYSLCVILGSAHAEGARNGVASVLTSQQRAKADARVLELRRKHGW